MFLVYLCVMGSAVASSLPRRAVLCRVSAHRFGGEMAFQTHHWAILSHLLNLSPCQSEIVAYITFGM